MSQQEEPRVRSIRDPLIDKVVVNMAVGRSGEPLQKAMTVLEQLTGQAPCRRNAKKTIREWGIRKTEPIACLVTLRGTLADEFLKRGLDAVGNRLRGSSFDGDGNFAFGIREHIGIPGVRYDPDLGIFGMDVCVVLRKPGYRVKRRRYLKATVGKRQVLSRQEAMDFIHDTYNVDLVDSSEGEY
jgi:large subunit ribosomal protein L5